MWIVICCSHPRWSPFRPQVSSRFINSSRCFDNYDVLSGMLVSLVMETAPLRARCSALLWMNAMPLPLPYLVGSLEKMFNSKVIEIHRIIDNHPYILLTVRFPLGMAGNQVLEWTDIDTEIKTANLKDVGPRLLMRIIGNIDRGSAYRILCHPLICENSKPRFRNHFLYSLFICIQVWSMGISGQSSSLIDEWFRKLNIALVDVVTTGELVRWYRVPCIDDWANVSFSSSAWSFFDENKPIGKFTF